MTNVTLAQLVLSAQAAANKAALPSASGAAPDALSIQSIKLEEFATTQFDRADFATFENAFNAQLEMLQTFSKQNSPATAAAKRQAAAGQKGE